MERWTELSGTAGQRPHQRRAGRVRSPHQIDGGGRSSRGAAPTRPAWSPTCRNSGSSATLSSTGRRTEWPADRYQDWLADALADSLLIPGG